ncbi:hypothetical protein HPB50_026187 [Hyalomma asiaticum]|uniref:Uncharacterized protein n=1 Tax=Hyalomma asiaticum TaxID=266040 RepID=A0ACB7RNM8_HYAAI|nr:hypothetical protein HPB50_026187 [Hyalomma asiaticum]
MYDRPDSRRYGPLRVAPVDHVRIGVPGPDDLMSFRLIVCPAEGFYRNGRFVFAIHVSDHYPYKPPEVKCETRVFHPNIDFEGNFELLGRKRNLPQMRQLRHYNAGYGIRRKCTTALIRVVTDLYELHLSTTCELVFPDPDDLMSFRLIVCPAEGFYRNGRFVFAIHVSDHYPYKPPEVKCETRVFHPNIDLEGNVCLKILRKWWNPAMSLDSVVVSVLFILLEPNTEDPFNEEAGHVLLHNRQLFQKYVWISMSGGRVGSTDYECCLRERMALENEYRGSVRFGVSLSPAYVESHGDYRPAFGGMMQRLADEYAVDSFGVLGATVSHMGLRPGQPATNWIAGISKSMDRLPIRGNLFVGLVLEAHYPSLRLDSARQRTLAETLRVDTLVLVTHLWDTASLQRSESCLTRPPSLWMRAASHDDTSKPTTPDLETSAHILGFLNSNVTRAYLSMTMAVMRYRLDESRSQSSYVMGVPCVEGHPTSFAETCSSVVRRGTRGGFDGRSLTPWFSKKGAMFTYEDRSSIAAKMKGCLHVLRSLGERRFGWALFDIEQELLHAEDCDLELVKPAAHGRIRTVRAILDAQGRAPNPPARRRRRRRR